MKIPAAYWDSICEIAAAYDCDPKRLLTNAAWQVVERGLDVVAAADGPQVDIDVDPAIEDMLAQHGPLLALFALAYWPRAAKAMRAPTDVQPTPHADRTADGKFKSSAARARQSTSGLAVHGQVRETRPRRQAAPAPAGRHNS